MSRLETRVEGRVKGRVKGRGGERLGRERWGRKEVERKDKALVLRRALLVLHRKTE